MFDSAGVNRKLLVDTQLSYGACGFIQSGMGVSLVDPLSALHYQRLGIQVRRFEPRIGYRYNLIYPALRTQSGLAKAFVKQLKADLKELQASNQGLLELIGDKYPGFCKEGENYARGIKPSKPIVN
ncbi:hypothetical protein [Oceanospirillum sediminis]|uniref:LysR substrate-binding domain-containing protein n=1 Tax=Oceanospirillum sediminis TaxID=2760088 RepID=A0A839IUF8_9GAMM|nr:hypothetical protein [Oceanospirillum sediminis]